MEDHSLVTVAGQPRIPTGVPVQAGVTVLRGLSPDKSHRGSHRNRRCIDFEQIKVVAPVFTARRHACGSPAADPRHLLGPSGPPAPDFLEGGDDGDGRATSTISSQPPAWATSVATSGRGTMSTSGQQAEPATVNATMAPSSGYCERVRPPSRAGSVPGRAPARRRRRGQERPTPPGGRRSRSARGARSRWLDLR